MSRSLRVAVQMDPIETINIDGDSTFALMLEAQARGHRLWHYHVRDLALRGGRVTAWAKPIELRREYGNHFTFGAEEELDLVHPRTLVVNDPASVRNAPEKLFVTHFPELMPVTMVTADRRRIADFRREHGDIIIKPLFGNGGAGVFHLRPDDPNMNSLVEMFTERSREPLMIQKYVPAVREWARSTACPRRARRGPTCMSAAAPSPPRSPTGRRRSAPRSGPSCGSAA